jgi:TonB family protein
MSHLLLWLPWLLSRPGLAQPADPAPPPAEAAPLELVAAPTLLEFVEATYPPGAKAQGREGRVVLQLAIDAEGAVTDVVVQQPAGHGFDEAAAQAARQLRFTPARTAAGPVPVAIEFAYGFELGESDAPAPVNLTLTLTQMGTRRPMADLPIAVTAADGTRFEAATDADGRAELRGVPPGTAMVVAGGDLALAREPVEVVADQLTEARVWVKAPVSRPDELVVVGARETTDITRRSLTIEEIRRVPGTFGDPVRVIQSLPGAARAPLGTGLLVIRGANPEDSGVYVDGIRIPLIYHLGGYSSVINADLVEGVDYLPGGFGVKYGRSMGGVVDVRTKSTFPEQTRVVWNTDALDTGVLVEGRLGSSDQLGFAVAGRRSYIDALLPLVLPLTGANPDFVIQPRWYDYQFKVGSAVDDGAGTWSLLVFGFQDRLIASTPPGFAQGTDPDTQGDLGTTYETHRALFRWERPLGDDWTLRLIPSIGVDGIDFSLGSSFRVEQWQLLAEVRSELDWEPTDWLQATAGIDFLGGGYTFETELAFNPESLSDYDPLAEREPWSTSGRGSAWGPDPYLDVVLRPLPDRDRLRLNPGVRVNRVSVTDARSPDPLIAITAVDPRLLGRLQVTDGGALKAGTGLYHQPPQPFELWRPEGQNNLGFERALSSEMGWEQQVSAALSADLSLFYKRLDDLIVENPTFAGLEDAYFVNAGIGRIYGGELMVRHAAVDRFFGWVSYTLSRSLRNDAGARAADADTLLGGDPDQGWYPFDFDQTHIFVAVAGWKLPRDWGVSGRVQAVTGNPTTPFDGGVYDIDQDFYFGYSSGPRNGERLPPFVAIDLRVDRTFTFKAWRLEAYLDLLNVVRGENPEFTLYNYDYTDSRYIRGLPFIPSPGVQAEFFF